MVPVTDTTTRLTKDPVRWANVLNALIAAVVATLLMAGILTEVAAGVIVGIAAAVNVAVGELFTRKETVPVRPLEALAAAREP